MPDRDDPRTRPPGRPARLTAALAAWVASRDEDELRGALSAVGLDAFPLRPGHHYVPKYYGRSAGKVATPMDDDEFLPLAREVRRQGLTSLYFDRLYTLYQAVRNVVRRFPQDRLGLLEAGVYRGGSSLYLARLAERYAPGRSRLDSVDTFEGHSAADLPAGREAGHRPGKFAATSAEDVRDLLAAFEFVTVHEGRVQDVAPGLEGPLHLIHLDVDIEAPTRFVLELALERMAPGGAIVVDDYGFESCPGVRRAVDEFVAGPGTGFAKFALDSGQCLLVAG
jgi:hypothetical protein